MKKIIYSLVMLIAAGSLLTSCIQPVETDGVLAMRLAKAKYIEALAGLQTANEAVVKAEAKYIEAQTSYLAQQEALLKAQTENQNLLNALQEILNAKEAALAELAKQDLANEIAFKQAMGQLELQIKGAELQKFLDDAAAEKLFNEETLRALKAANDIELAFLADSLALVLRAGELEIAITQEQLNALIAANENTAAENAYAEALRALNLSIEEAKAKAQIDSINAAAAVAAVKAQQNLAEAQAELAATLEAIEKALVIDSLSLTDEEAALIRKATTDYRNALDQYQTAVAQYQTAYNEYLDACQLQITALYDNSDAVHGFGEQYQKDYDDAVAALAKWEEMLAEFTDAEADAAYWKGEMDKYKAQAEELRHINHLIDEDYVKVMVDYRVAYQSLLAALSETMSDEKFVKPEDPAATAYLTYGLDEEGNLTEDATFATNYYVANFFYGAAYNWINYYGILNIQYNTSYDAKEYMSLWVNDIPLDLAEYLIYANFESLGEELKEDYSGLKEIIETLEREKVIVNNADRDSLAAGITKLANEATKAYTDHKAALEAGREADAGVIAARTAFENWKADTTAKGAAYRKAVKDSIDAEAAAKIARDAAKAQNLATFKADSAAAVAQAKADSTAIMKAAKDSAKVLTDAVGDGTTIGFVHDINYFYTQISTPDKDTTALLKAITEFAGVIKKYGAPVSQTQITIYDGKDADNHVKTKKVSIDALVKAQFTANGEICTKALRHGQDPTVETSFGGISDAFRYVIQVLIQNTSWDGTVNLNVADVKIGTKTAAQIASEIIAAAQVLADKETGEKLEAKIAALLVIKNAADIAADKAYNDVLTAEHTKVKNAYTAYQTSLAKESSVKNGIKNAINKYYEIYDAFWGYAIGTHTVAVDQSTPPFASESDSLHIVWGEGTFTEPHDIMIGNVELNPGYKSVKTMEVYSWNQPLNTVLIALDYVDTPSSYDITGSYDPEGCFIVKGPDDFTELTKMLLLNYDKKFLENYTENLMALENLKAWVDGLETAYKHEVKQLEEAIAIYNDKYNTWAENMKAFTGEDEIADAEAMFNAVAAFVPDFFGMVAPYEPKSLEDFVDAFGAYPAGYVFAEGGELAAMVNEHMTVGGIEYTAYMLLNIAEQTYNTYWADQFDLVADMLNDVYTTCMAHENPDAGINPTFDTFDEAYQKVIDYLEGNIEAAKNNVEVAKKVLALYEAGVDAHDIATEKALLALEVAEANLTLAEERLTIAETNLEAKKAAYEAVVAVYLTDNTDL
ncbi:MAG: hypothetical protein IKO77_05750 [Bacteroidales bacterium]|nr:hypothetical protein [Bacteroidales bacterium]